MWKKCAYINVIMITLLGSVLSYGQNQSLIDSVEAAWGDYSIQRRMNVFLDIAFQYMDKNNDLALALIERAEKEALLSTDTLSMIMCWRIKGHVLYRMERTDEAINLFEFALPIAVRNGFDRDRMMILASYGIALMFRCEYDLALQYFFRAQDLAVFQNERGHYEMVLHNIGLVYYKLKDYRKAIFYWKDATQYEVLTEDSDIRRINISLCYANLAQFNKARAYLNEAAQLCGEGCSDADMIQIKYASGYIYYGLKDYQAAEVEFLISYEYAVRIGDIRMQLDNIYMLADLYQKRDLIDQAFHYLNEAEKHIGVGVSYNLEIIKIYSRLADLYLAQREFQNAALYQRRYIALRDSIYDESLTTGLMRVEAEHLEKGHRAEVAAQNEIISLKEKMISHQRILNIVTGLLAFLVLISSFFIYRNYLQKRNLTRLLNHRVKERTAELESSHSELVSVVRESEIIIARIAHDVIETMSTIRGLCGAGKTEIKDHVSHSYFTKINEVSLRLTEQLESVYAPITRP